VVGDRETKELVTAPRIEPKSFDPRRPDFAPYGFTCEIWRPARMQRADRHNEIELNFIQAGSLIYLLGGRKVIVPAGKLTIFWAAYPHQIIDYTMEHEYFVATIPLAWFLQAGFPREFVDALIHGQMLLDPSGTLPEVEIQAFRRWVRDIDQQDPYRKKLVFLEMEARLLRLALDVRNEMQNGGVRSGKHLPVQLGCVTNAEKMLCYMAQHYTERLTSEQISREVGLHPNYAMFVFKKTFGITLNECLTQLRVAHAQRLLVTTDMKILDVALESGFTSLSRFYEAFKKVCGSSPTEYRKNHALF